MKHKIITRILIIFVGFLIISGLALFVFKTVRNNKVSKINDRREKIMSQNLILVEQRLAYMEIAKLELDEEDAFEIIQSNLSRISGFDARNVEDEDLRQDIESVNNSLISQFETYKKIVEYDIKQDFYNALANEDYDALLGKVNALVEGMNSYENKGAIQSEMETIKQSASLLSSSLYDQNYDGLITIVGDLYQDYDELKQIAIKEVKAPLVSDAGVGMLTDLTNLIISNQNELISLE